MLRNRAISISMVLGLGLGLLLTLLWGLRTPVIRAQGSDEYTTYYVAPSCVGAPTPCYTTVQAAVDATDDPGDLIKVATGTYTDVSVRPRRDTIATGVVTQVVYISKTVTIRGGYTTTNWFTPDPNANPTTLDAQGQGRVLYVTGNISTVFEGLGLTGGDPTGLEGAPAEFEDAGGGVVVITANATISNCQLFNNSASKGGGVYLLYSNADLVGNAITSNTAHYIGGVLASSSNANLRGNLIAANIAEGSAGGGLYLHWGNTMVAGNTVISNTANRNGGGIVIVGGDVILVNNIIADNKAGAEGGGIRIFASSPRLLHNTIACNNSSNGDGIYVSDYSGIFSSVKLTNTILVSHAVGIHVRDGNTVTLEATLWGSDVWANRDDWGGDGTVITGTINVRGNPGFIDPDSGDYHIVESSSAVDRGLNAGVEDDIDGEPRPYPYGSEEYDIGADEFHPNLNLTVTKYASSDPVHTGAQLTYTIFVTNTGSVTLSATITDILPTQIVPTGVLTWTTVITAPGGTWSQAVPATVAMWYAGPLTNVVRVTTKEGVSGVYTCTTEAIVQHCHLPLMLRDF